LEESHQNREPDVIEVDLGVERAAFELDQVVGMVVDLELLDGGRVCGVLGAVSTEALILEHWEAALSGPNGDPFTVCMKTVRRVLVP
jgi:hypothetical protein